MNHATDVAAFDRLADAKIRKRRRFNWRLVAALAANILLWVAIIGLILAFV